MISHDNSALAPYYKRYAFLRDIETLSLAIETLIGLSRFNFNLPVNSSMLNSWPNPPLLLAGLWTPPMKDVPVMLGTDIVKGIVEVVEVEENMSIASCPSSSGRLYEEEEALKIILGTPIEGSPLQSRVLAVETDEFKETKSDTEMPSEASEEVSGRSDFVEDVCQSKEFSNMPDSHQIIKSEEEVEINSTLESYHKIIDDVNIGDTNVEKDHLKDIIEKYWFHKEKKEIKSPTEETGFPKSPSMQRVSLL